MLIDGRPTVVKAGGRLLDDPTALDAVLEALDAARRRGARPVLVHGGGDAVDARLARLGLGIEKRDGLRVTPEDQIDEIVAVLAGIVNTRLVGRAVARGIPAVGLSLGDGGMVRSAVAHGGALGRVGAVTGGDPKLIRSLIDRGYLPIVSSIGMDADGAPLNVNADEAAAGLAAVLGAPRVVLLTDAPGVLDASGKLLPMLDADCAATAIESGVVVGGMIPKVRAALDAAARCGAEVFVAGWRDPDALAAISDRGGRAGTCVLPPAPRSVGSRPVAVTA